MSPRRVGAISRKVSRLNENDSAYFDGEMKQWPLLDPLRRM